MSLLNCVGLWVSLFSYAYVRANFIRTTRFREAVVERCSYLQNSCSQNFCKLHRKTPVLESLFNKVAGLNLKACNFLLKKEASTVKFVKFLRAPFLQNTSSGCFWRLKLVKIRTSQEHFESGKFKNTK